MMRVVVAVLAAVFAVGLASRAVSRRRMYDELQHILEGQR